MNDVQFAWQEEFNIGVSSIDREHRQLLRIINKLFALRQEEKDNQWACQEAIKFFKTHAIRHFADEEEYMESIGYEGLEQHKRVHKGFRENTLPALEQELKRTEYSPDAVDHFLGVCAGWLIGHTLTEDRAITGKVVSKWGDLLPEEEQSAMRRLILQLMDDMFQLKARVVSECYGGEKFGKGIYYRLAYRAGRDKQWEIILVFEEKLLINTIGSMLDTQAGEINVMIMNAARYTAQQFVERIQEQFLSSELYEMKEENLLSYEQFQKRMEGKKPQFSLLFDTGEGYFAFCAIAPHLTQDGAKDNVKGGISIKAENAMSEVKKYLDNNQETKVQVSKKRKLLVVDDSEFLRMAMKELLGKEYEITEASSGLSAIRCITLDRPDLVLLDYEMPVCDGSQVLEMIRSEEEIADIPVMFLTSRVDKESVQKVISLKPSGYLLKTLSPEKIKKEIDDYFKKKK